MKKLGYVLIVCVIVVLAGVMLSGNRTSSALQKAVGANNWQRMQIEKLLREELMFECEGAEEADMKNPVLKNMDSDYAAYTIWNEKGKEYILILRTADKSVTCILDDKNRLAFGMIDNGILPNYQQQSTMQQKLPISQGDFWNTEETDSDNILRFTTGLEIILPKEWGGKITLDVEDDVLAVCEKTNNAVNKSGVLFYLRLSEYEKGYMSYTTNTVLGLYQQENAEYVLSFLEPRDLQYVEGDDEKKAAYEELFSLLDSVQIVTEHMNGFAPCTIDDLEWLGDEDEL